MIIGIPKEIKESEWRVALTPKAVKKLKATGCTILVEGRAGAQSWFTDKEYRRAGAQIVNNAAAIWKKAELICKVKEPQPTEWRFLRQKQILLTFLHLAASPLLARVLQKKQVTAIDYATVQLEDGTLPILKPMSEIAGKLAPQIGAYFLERRTGGKGVLLGGTQEIPPATVLIVGAGTVGSSAAEIALGMGARVFIADKNRKRLDDLKKRLRFWRAKFFPFLASRQRIGMLLTRTDLLIGAVLIPGAEAPKLITGKMVQIMERGSVIVDVAIDQGGCIETSRPTNHQNPVFVKYGVLHYCVPNIPSLVSQTASSALSQEVLPYLLEIVRKAFSGAVKKNPALARGINVYQGKITHPQVAKSLREKYFPLRSLLLT